MKFDVIIVLAGGITKHGTLPNSVLQRVKVAKELYDQQSASKVLMSGRWSAHWEHLPPAQTEAQLMLQYAVSLGIPKKAIFIEEHSQNTKENAFYILKLFVEPRKWKKLLVVTSDFHIPRARRIFKRVLGPEHQIEFVGTHVHEGVIKRAKQRSKEAILLYTQWFFHYLLDGC